MGLLKRLAGPPGEGLVGDPFVLMLPGNSMLLQLAHVGVGNPEDPIGFFDSQVFRGYRWVVVLTRRCLELHITFGSTCSRSLLLSLTGLVNWINSPRGWIFEEDVHGQVCSWNKNIYNPIGVSTTVLRRNSTLNSNRSNQQRKTTEMTPMCSNS